ncbi:MAG: DUF1905 domain-containing protein [Blastocatellia bacterium]
MRQRFNAIIYKSGPLYCVDVPPEVSASLGERGHVPVAGTINRLAFASTLTPAGAGRHRLFINGEIRRGARVKTGDGISIELERDDNPRDIELPADVAEALDMADLLEVFQRQTPSDKRIIIKHLREAKSEATRERRIETLARRLLERR